MQPQALRHECLISIHALREEGDVGCWADLFPAGRFLSTPSARRATPQQPVNSYGGMDFYPRPPRGGRLYSCVSLLAGRQISIHALREEGDCVPINIYGFM